MRVKALGRATAVGMSLLLLSANAVWADNTVADGDGVTPVGNNDMALGSVSCSAEASKTALVAISRQGTGTNTFGNGEVITVSVRSVTGAGLSASIPSNSNTIALAGDWGGKANGTLSNAVSASVNLTSTAEGAGSGSVEFRATGKNAAGSTITRDDTMLVSWTTGTCAAPDTTAPSVGISLDPSSPNGANLWYVSGVEVTVSASDASDLASVEYKLDSGAWEAYAAPFIVSADGNHTVDARATDASPNSNVGNATQATFKIDQTDPSVSLVDGPADGTSYYFGSVPAAPTCSANDVTSGLSGTVSPTGYSAAVGNHTVSCSATDNAGNQASDSASYTVLAWSTLGFYSPVDMGSNFLNSIKGGQTVPLKFELFAGTTELTSTSAVSFFRTKELACGTFAAAAIDDVEITSTGGTVLRYDTTGGQFIQNWQTPKTTNKCYSATVGFQDGSSITAYFKTK